MQLRFDFDNKNCRFLPDTRSGTGAVRSRIWRAMDQITWSGPSASRNWGAPLPVNEGDGLTLTGLKKEDSVYVLVTAQNLPAHHTVRIVGIVSRKDKAKSTTLEGSPFYWNNNESSQEQSFFDSGAHAGVNGTIDGQTATVWWLGAYRGNDMKVHTNTGESMQLTVAVQVLDSEDKVVRDYSFDPEMDVGGGD